MQAKLRNLITKLREDERGLSTVEYVVLLVLIVAIAVAVWNLFGQSLVGKLTAAAVEFDSEVQTKKEGSAEEGTSANPLAEDMNTAGEQGKQ